MVASVSLVWRSNHAADMKWNPTQLKASMPTRISTNPNARFITITREAGRFGLAENHRDDVPARYLVRLRTTNDRPGGAVTTTRTVRKAPSRAVFVGV